MRLFLYGTLIGASDTPMARWLAPRLRGAARASVAGRLFAVPSRGGWFPALLRGGGRVWGVIGEAALGPADLARLDRYEGNQYRRVARPVRARGRPRRAELYLWRAVLPPGALPIPGGDFLAWLADTGRRPLSIDQAGSTAVGRSA